jgi:hypothetical protein
MSPAEIQIPTHWYLTGRSNDRPRRLCYRPTGYFLPLESLRFHFLKEYFGAPKNIII